MPKIKLSHFECHYLFEDYGKEITLVFSNSLGTNFSMWDENIPYLKEHFNILRSDTRGHGKSTIDQEIVAVEKLGNDVIELLNYLKLDKVIFCGLSMGGLIGQWLGIHYPERCSGIVLCNTAAKIGTEEGWNIRITQVTNHGLSSILEGTAQRWFIEEYREKYPEKVTQILQNFENNSVQGYVACCAMVRDADFRTELNHLKVPSLIVCGAQDEVTTVTDGTFLQEQIPNAQLVVMEAAHLSNLANPEEFSKHIIHFAQHLTQ
ncbi:3-oxoadipate enol-lactonase [Flavobacterium sp. HXWNR69]|uniref:3-oxoadipate enol-lactonase n=1 Tax=Flavobacterium fragile TaxID=2949085 RepID=A0ABT0TH96_9FLAO|nr:3-oxoadipate enol-lactonase [Flavobacterium sp. HXWNR69]MCL9770346.1 3-oxoadipate enol-lactonase [Flavobacterium sp. HXWNR69]